MIGDDFIQTYPWLSSNLFYKITHNTNYNDFIDEIINFDEKIRAYCDGWLVLEYYRNFFLLNVNDPFREKIDLPLMNPYLRSVCILTCSPSNSSCRVLFIAKDKILYWQPREKKYKRCRLPKSMHVEACPYMVTVLEGKVYYIIEDDPEDPKFDLAMIDCDGSTLQISRVQCLQPPESNFFYDSFLTESGGKLLLIFKVYLEICSRSPLPLQVGERVYTDVFCFKVFQFDFLDNKWIEIVNIGNYTIFLSSPLKTYMRSSGISFRATMPQIKPNSIYFLDDYDEYIHVFYLENNTFSLLANGLKVVTSQSQMIQEKSNGNLDCEEQDTKFLPKFPLDLSNLILARLFTIDHGALGVIRSVCKDWSSVVRPCAYNIDMSYHKHPYLVTLVNGTCKFFHPTYNHTFCLDTPELLGANIKFSRFGWLLLSRYIRVTRAHEYFFFNLFTKERKNLPVFVEFVTMSFSSPPTSSDCFVVGVVSNAMLATIKYGEENWSYYEEPFGQIHPNSKHTVSYHPAFYKQKCYYLLANKKLVVIDFNTRNFWVVGKIFPTEPFEFRGCFLVEDKEGLLGIFLQTEKKTPHVMRMDLSQKKMLWQPIENLNDKMIYVSHAASWADSAPTKSTGNKIYFPMLWNSDCVFYSLSTKNYLFREIIVVVIVHLRH